MERSVNSNDWEVIGFVKGSGTSNEPHDYSFTDHNILKSLYYYRLMQHDYEENGEKTSYSNVISLVDNNVTAFSATIAPNIFSEIFTVNYSNAPGGSLRMTMFSTSGDIVFEKSFSTQDVFGTINVNIEKEIPSGIYLLKIKSGNLVSTLKVVKQ